VYLLQFLRENEIGGTRLCVAARIRNDGDTFRAGLVAEKTDGEYVSDDGAIIVPGMWRRWRLKFLRLATRETAAILHLDDCGRMGEHACLNWDSRTGTFESTCRGMPFVGRCPPNRSA